MAKVVNYPDDSTVSPRVIGGLLEPWQTESKVCGIRIDQSGSIYVSETTRPNEGANLSTNIASSLDMFKYQVGIDAGEYYASSGSNIVTLSSYFNTFRRDQFPKYVYAISENRFYEIISFSSSVIIGTLTQSILVLDSPLKTSLTNNHLVIKYNAPRLEYDSSVGGIKTSVLNTSYGRYTTPAYLGASTISNNTWNNVGSTFSTEGYNVVHAYLTLNPSQHTDIHLRLVHKTSINDTDVFKDYIVSQGSAHYTLTNTQTYKLPEVAERIHISFNTLGSPYCLLQVFASSSTGGPSGSITASIAKAYV